MQTIWKQFAVFAGIIVLIIFLFELQEIRVSYPAGANIYQKDFLYFVKVLEKTHPGWAAEPLPFKIREQWDAEVKAVYNSLSGDESLSDFYFELSRFAAKLEDGHTLIEFPEDTAARYLPLEFLIIDNEMYVTMIHDDRYADMLFARILTINGITDTQLLELIDGYLSADAGNDGWKYKLYSPASNLLRTDILYNYLGLLENPRELQVTFSDAGGAAGTATVAFSPGRTSLPLQNLTNLGRSDITRFLAGNHYQVLKEAGAVYFQLNRLPVEVDEELLNMIFQSLQDPDMNILIVDLRNNSGGSSLWSSIFLRHLIDEPAEMSIYQGWERRYTANRRTGPAVRSYEPLPPYFDGRVYLLTGPRTMSSATFFIVGVQDNHLGTVIGEPAGNNNVRYGYTRHDVLPHTRLRFTSSVRIWERVQDGSGGRNSPIEPDIYIPATIDDIRLNRDPVWEYILVNILQNGEH